MLVHQGALAFELWTGYQPPLDIMRAAAQQALASIQRAAESAEGPETP
jgi:shikimate 5-dehydrogenase